jgi:shikimate kinase
MIVRDNEDFEHIGQTERIFYFLVTVAVVQKIVENAKNAETAPICEKATMWKNYREIYEKRNTKYNSQKDNGVINRMWIISFWR